MPARTTMPATRSVREVSPEIEVLSTYVAQVGESPVWDACNGVLYWVDIEGHSLLQWTYRTGATRQWRFDREVCSMGLSDDQTLVLALRDGVYRFDPKRAARSGSPLSRSCEALTLIAEIEADIPTNRLNDGKVGPDGAFWVGSMDQRAEKTNVASLYRVGSDGRAQRVGEKVKVSNGLGFSPDGGYVYHSDSRGPWILRYPFDPVAQTVGAAVPWIEMQVGWGRPDGAAVDVTGCYWSCGIDAGRINRFSPEGELVEVYRLPVTHPTMCCFGGANHTTLFVTSLLPPDAALAATQPLAGRLFSFQVAVPGLPASRFKSSQTLSSLT